MSQAGDLESEYGEDNINFWSPKQYMKTVKRMENSYRLCQDLMLLILERSELEKHYAGSLKRWSSKWLAFIEVGTEYGTAKTGWQALCNEALEIAEIHSSIRNQLIEETQPDIKKWQKEHYHKPTIPGQPFKEVKTLELEFEYIQKPWNKKLKKCNVSKKEYHTACKQEKSLTIQLQNMKIDSTQNSEQIRKIEEKLKKAEKEVEKSKTVYQAALNDLEGDSGRYMEEMEKTFKKAQSQEQERIEYFKEVFESIRSILDISKEDQLKKIYEDCKSSINEINSEVDLKIWSITNGSAMVFALPQFEEYTPELSGMSNKNRKILNSGTVTLKNVTNTDLEKSHQNSVGNNENNNKHSEPRTDVTKLPAQIPKLPSYDEAMNPFSTFANDETSTNNGQISSGVNNVSNDSFYDSLIVDDHQPGISVKALYDYISQEEDELNLVAGEIFEKLEEEDEQGWCKGRCKGVIGLYPANYAENI